MKKKTALITGIRGQDGAYLAKLLLDKGYKVYGADRRSGGSSYWRLDELCITDKIEFVYMELTEFHNICNVIKKIQPDEIYNLGAMSFVQASFDQPFLTANVNAIGQLNILEAVKQHSFKSKVYFAGTSEQFGKVQEIPQTETTPFYPRSPYGVAKQFGFDMTRNYRESYGIFCCSGILFNHESELRGSEFITRKISKSFANMYKAYLDGVKPEPLIIGNMYAKRDWGDAEDFCSAMIMMLQQNVPDDFVISTGETNTVKAFINEAWSIISETPLHWVNIGKGTKEYAIDFNDNIVVKVSKEFYRPAEVDLLLGDSTKAKEILGWTPKTNFHDLVKKMVNKDIERVTK